MPTTVSEFDGVEFFMEFKSYACKAPATATINPMTNGMIDSSFFP